MYCGTLLIIFTTGFGLISPFDVEADGKKHLGLASNCIDNPNGMITEINGEPFENNDEFNHEGEHDADMKETFILSKKQHDFLQAKSHDEHVEEVQQRVVIQTDDSDMFDLWPNREAIPYQIDTSLTDGGKKAVNLAIQDIQRFTCVRFKEKSKKDKYFLIFSKGKSCQSDIGMRRDKANTGQRITIDERCEKKGIVLHLIMHAFGFLNEHTREDRDIYVEINWENIIPAKKKYFKVTRQFVQNTLGSCYDYSSVMHLGRKKYSKNGKDTISIFGCSKKAKKILKIIGQRVGLSKGDIFQINKLFKCPSSTKSGSFSNDGFNRGSNTTKDSEMHRCKLS